MIFYCSVYTPDGYFISALYMDDARMLVGGILGEISMYDVQNAACRPLGDLGGLDAERIMFIDCIATLNVRT
jgi:hypothetical protein